MAKPWRRRSTSSAVRIKSAKASACSVFLPMARSPGRRGSNTAWHLPWPGFYIRNYMTKIDGSTAADVIRDLQAAADPVKAAFLPHFFKTGMGEYGEGDRFIGVVVPQQRILARKYADLSLT